MLTGLCIRTNLCWVVIGAFSTHDSKPCNAFFYVGATEELVVATSDLLDIFKVQFSTGFFDC